MTEAARSFIAPDFLTLTLGIVVYFAGVLLTQRVAFLRNYNIPEPVTGGFLAALAIWALHAGTGLSIALEMATRDAFLQYLQLLERFFSCFQKRKER